MSLYIRLQTDVLTDPKALMAGPEGFNLWVKGLLYSKQHLTDGFVPEAAFPIIAIGIKNPKKVAEALVSIGLWERAEGGYTVGAEKWARHQTTREQVVQEQARNKERQQRYREDMKRKRNGVTHASRNGVSNGEVTQPEPEYIDRVQSHSTEPETLRKDQKSISDETQSSSEVSPVPESKKPKRERIPENRDQVLDYMLHLGWASSVAEEQSQQFWDHFNSNGWKVGKAKAPMNDWRSAVGTWGGRMRERGIDPKKATASGGRLLTGLELAGSAFDGQ